METVFSQESVPSYCLEYKHIDMTSVGTKKHVGVICQTATFTSLGLLTMNEKLKRENTETLVHIIFTKNSSTKHLHFFAEIIELDATK